MLYVSEEKIKKLIEKYESKLRFTEIKAKEQANNPMFFVISQELEDYFKIVEDLKELLYVSEEKNWG